MRKFTLANKIYRYFDYTASSEKWISILSSADKWQMDSVRTKAVKALGEIPLYPLVKLQICIQYGIGYAWAKDALVSLCERSGRIKMEETSKLDMNAMVIIADVREQLAATAIGSIQRKRKAEGLVEDHINAITRVVKNQKNLQLEFQMED